jgi:uncharacterized integral membrane protein
MNIRSAHDGDGSSGFQLPSLKLVALLVVVVVAAIFFLQNGPDTEVEILAWTVTWPLRLVILVSIVLGIVIDRLGSWMWRRSRRRGG